MLQRVPGCQSVVFLHDGVASHQNDESGLARFWRQGQNARVHGREGGMVYKHIDTHTLCVDTVNATHVGRTIPQESDALVRRPSGRRTRADEPTAGDSPLSERSHCS